MQGKLDLTAVNHYLTPILAPERFSSNNLGRTKFKEQFQIHTISTVPALLQEMQAQNEPGVLRFAVDITNTAFFAREKGKFISPPHGLMTGMDIKSARCFTAGNIFLNEGFDTLIKVNHQSGDFRPSFESLKRFLAILVLNEDELPFALPEALIVEEMNTSGAALCEHVYLLSELRVWANTITGDELLAELRNQVKPFILVPELSELVKSRYRTSRAIPMSFMDAIPTEAQGNTAHTGSEAAAAAASSPFSMRPFRLKNSPAAASSSPFSMRSFQLTDSPATTTISSPSTMGSFQLTDSPSAMAASSPSSLVLSRLAAAATSSPSSSMGFFRHTNKTPTTSQAAMSSTPPSSESTPRKRDANRALFSDIESPSDEKKTPKKPEASAEAASPAIRRRLF